MKKTLWFITLTVFICASSFATVWAEEKKAEAKQDVTATMTAKEKVEYAKKADLFIQLATFGETQKDPLLIISAIKVMDDLPFKGIVKPGQPEKGGAYYDREALINQAKQYAAQDSELLAVIAKVQTPPEKTEVRGHHGPHGYQGPRGDRYDYGYYYDRPRHHRHFRCDWIQICRHGNCRMVCR